MSAKRATAASPLTPIPAPPSLYLSLENMDAASWIERREIFFTSAAPEKVAQEKALARPVPKTLCKSLYLITAPSSAQNGKKSSARSASPQFPTAGLGHRAPLTSCGIYGWSRRQRHFSLRIRFRVLSPTRRTPCAAQNSLSFPSAQRHQRPCGSAPTGDLRISNHEEVPHTPRLRHLHASWDYFHVRWASRSGRRQNRLSPVALPPYRFRQLRLPLPASGQFLRPPNLFQVYRRQPVAVLVTMRLPD